MRKASTALKGQKEFNLALVVKNEPEETLSQRHDRSDDSARESLSPVITAAVDSDRPLTVAEVARFFQCNAETIKRQARSGNLPGFKFGKFWYFRRADIDLMISQAVESSRAIGAASVEDQ